MSKRINNRTALAERKGVSAKLETPEMPQEKGKFHQANDFLVVTSMNIIIDGPRGRKSGNTQGT